MSPLAFLVPMLHPSPPEPQLPHRTKPCIAASQMPVMVTLLCASITLLLVSVQIPGLPFVVTQRVKVLVNQSLSIAAYCQPCSG